MRSHIKVVELAGLHKPLAMLFLIFIYYLVQGASESIDTSSVPALENRSLAIALILVLIVGLFGTSF